jgi:hypothetical protein
MIWQLSLSLVWPQIHLANYTIHYLDVDGPEMEASIPRNKNVASHNKVVLSALDTTLVHHFQLLSLALNHK